jgi:hypothetical protein
MVASGQDRVGVETIVIHSEISSGVDAPERSVSSNTG